MLRRAYAWLERVYPRWMRNPLLRKLNLLLHQLTLRGMGVLNFEDLDRTGEHGFIRKVLPTLLTTPKPTMFDVGAHDGDYAVLLLEQFPDARVIGFEAHPHTFERLEARGLPVEVVNAAVSSSPGTLELWDYGEIDGSQHASTHREAIEELRKSDAVRWEVGAVTLDDWCAEHGIGHIDFLKIDVEGAEEAVLEGAKGLFAGGAVDVVQLEFNEMNVLSHTFVRDLIRILDGYELYRLLPVGMLHLHPYRAVVHEIFAFQNLVAIRRGLLADPPPAWIATA